MKPSTESDFDIEDKSLFHLETDKRSSLDSSQDLKEDAVEFKSLSFQCLRSILQLLYCSFVYPYKVVLNTEERTVLLVSSTPRKVIWTFIQMYSVGYVIYATSKTFPLEKKIAEDPTKLYKVAMEFTWLVAIAAWPFCVVSSKKSVCQLLNTSYRLDDGVSLLSKRKLEPYLMFTLLGILIFLCIREAVQVLVRFVITEILPGESSVDSYTFFKVIAFAIHASYNWTVFVPGITSGFVIYGISRDYLNYVESWRNSDEQFVKTYKVVKKLVNEINSVSSFYTFLMIISLLTEFCNNFTFLLGDKTLHSEGEWEVRVTLLSYFLIFTFSCILGAEAHSKFQKVDQYIMTNIGKSYDMDKKVDGIFLQNDISQNPLGVRAHHFIISYSVLATILSTALTYIFILLQFQSAAKSKDV